MPEAVFQFEKRTIPEYFNRIYNHTERRGFHAYFRSGYDDLFRRELADVDLEDGESQKPGREKRHFSLAGRNRLPLRNHLQTVAPRLGDPALLPERVHGRHRSLPGAPVFQNAAAAGGEGGTPAGLRFQSEVKTGFHLIVPGKRVIVFDSYTGLVIQGAENR